MLLQARGKTTAGDLARELEVSERTVYRDLEALSAAGVPVLTESGPGGGCFLPEKYTTNLTGLTEAEVRGLFLSLAPASLAGLGLDKAVEAAVLKLSAALPSSHRLDLERTRQRIHVDTARWFHPTEPAPFLAMLQEAVWRGLRVLLAYQRGDGARVRRSIEPYGLVAKANVWYMVGAMSGPRLPFGVTNVQTARRMMQVYRVSRVLSVELTEEPFARPHGFDLQAYWAEWCAEFEAGLFKYPVKLRVAPDYISVLPRVYGEEVRTLIDQAGPPDTDGYITLTLIFESAEEACGRLLGVGTKVAVLEPEELRQDILEAASEIVAFYGADAFEPLDDP